MVKKKGDRILKKPTFYQFLHGMIHGRNACLFDNEKKTNRLH